MRFGSWLLVLSSVLMTSLTAKAVRIVVDRPLWGELATALHAERSPPGAGAAAAGPRADCEPAPHPQSDEAVLVDVLSTSAALRTPVMRVAPADRPACLLPAIAPAPSH